LCAITSRKPHFPGERKRPRLLRRVWMERTRGLSSGGSGFARLPSSRGGHGGELPEVVREDAPHDPRAAVLEPKKSSWNPGDGEIGVYECV